MYLQEKTDQKSQILKMLNDFKTPLLCKTETLYVPIYFSKQKQNPATPTHVK